MATPSTRPRFTIITPTFNQAKTLERTICSVLDQGYEDLEFIVIDGGSTDETVDILRLYEDDLTCWISQPDLGPADAVNRALKIATGDVIGILPSDDVYLPSTLDRVAAAFDDTDTDWLVGQCDGIDDRDVAIPSRATEHPQSLASYLMHDSGHLPLPATFFAAYLFNSYGPFDSDLQVAWDYEFSCRLMAFGKQPRTIGYALAAKRMHSQSMTAQQTIRTGREHIAAARRFASQLQTKQRVALWRNCDRRQRIYALAEAEMRADHSRTFVWKKVLQHPWWLSDTNLRHVLLHGVDHPLPSEEEKQPTYRYAA